MTLDVRKGVSTGRGKSRHSFVYVLGILVVGTVMTWLIYDGIKNNQSSTGSPEQYRYSVDQSLDHSVTYFKNSYFNTTTPLQSEAYVRELTDTINTNFRYTYQANYKANLSYTYAVTAHVVAANPSKDQNQTVWDETYQLVPAVSKSEVTDSVQITKGVTLPFQEYSRRIAQINAGLSLGLEANVQLVFSVTLTGDYDGKPINDSQTMIVNASLSEPVYKVTDTYRQRSSGAVENMPTRADLPWWRLYRTSLSIGAAILLITIAILWIRPWSGRRFSRSPYQRELAKIYRYHDGLIIRTQHRINVEDREFIPVNSFEDLLNLSEELRVPIIANDLSMEATQFLVLQDRTVYGYTVGNVPKESYKVSGIRS